MLELRLPFGLGIEADALYRPIDATISTQVLPSLATLNSQTVTTWQFPILGKLHVPFPIVHPYVEAGPSFRHLGGIFDSYWSNKGFTVGIGAEAKIIKVRIAPEFRYTRWGSDPTTARSIVPLSGQNQGEFLVGISF